MPSSENCKRPPSFGRSALVLLGVILLVAPVISAEDVDDETCLACHDVDVVGLSSGPHRLGGETPQPDGKIACISCHDGGAVHIEDPSVDNIFNPATGDISKSLQLCSSCHEPHREPSGIAYDHLMKSGVACVSCHSVHEESSISDPEQVCGSCHVAQTSQFASTSNHPVIGDELACLDCHTAEANNMPHQGEGPSVDCRSCHPEQAGPHLYEHEAAWSFSTEGAGCVSCHDAHGSVNDRLLKQPDDRLCRQCHGTPPRHRVAHEGLATNYGCIDCHSQVHGSNSNRNLLDPQLGTIIGDGPEGCYCHNVYE